MKGAGGTGGGAGGTKGTGGTGGGAGGAKGPTPIKCGSVSCQPPGEQCCETFLATGLTFMCSGSTAPCPTGYAVTCADATACASNQICCALTPGNGAPGTTCMPADFCAAAHGSIVCTIDADCAKAHQRCCYAETYNTCADSCTIQ